MLRYFRKSKVEQVVFAGKIFKDRILHSGLGWIGHAPDLTCVRVLGGSFITRSRDGADDTILSAVTEEFLRRGIEVLTIQQCAPDILVEAGVVGNVVPSIQQNSDIDFGWKIAKGMGGLDVGQSIIVKDQMVIAVEAVEGTDSLVKRSAELCPRGGFTLIKVAKPNQDMRFDVPTVGVQTIRRMAECGGRAIAIDADKTIMVDREQTIALANALGIAIVALRDDQIGLVRQTSNQDSTKRESELSSQATTGGLSRGSYPFNRYRAA
jgi:hypothetical protein